MTSRGSRRTGISRARFASAALLALALSGAGARAADPLYQWTDDQGNVRYTPDPDRVPSGQRGSLVTLEPGAAPAPVPARGVVIPAEPRMAAPAPPAQLPAPIVAPPAPIAAPIATPTPSEPPIASPAPLETPMATPAASEPPVATPAPLETPIPASAPVAAPQAAPPPVEVPPESAAPASAPTAPPPTPDAALLEKQLSAAIAADQETLKTLLAAPVVPGATELVDSPELRAIARRLPELQAQLRALREQPSPPAGP